MAVRIFFFLVGFGFTVIGSVYIISYLNLFTIGYNLSDYVKFIIRRIECWYFLVGLVLIFTTIFMPKGDEYELYL